MTQLTLTPGMETVLTGLRKHKQYVFEFGQRIHNLYPPAKIDPEVFGNITVPIPLPIAMMLLGVGCELLAKTEPAKEVDSAA